MNPEQVQQSITPDQANLLYGQIAELQNMVIELRNNQSTATPSHSSRPTKHLNKPPEFDGRDKHFCTKFISHVNLYVTANPILFPTDRDKIAFAVSYLRGQAFDWFEPHLLKSEEDKAKDELLNNYDTFTKALVRDLGDPDRKRNITTQLQNLRQLGSAASYSTKFFQLASALNWDDEALCAQFYAGLKSEVKDAMVYADAEPANVNELSTIAIKLDNRLHERRLEGKPRNSFARQGPQPPFRSSSRTGSAPNSSSSSGPRPMDLDATKTTRFKPLTNEERLRRMKENLCLYCGKSGHRVDSCPEKARKPKGRLQATLSPDSQIVFHETTEGKDSA
jgi:hypothetical protein